MKNKLNPKNWEFSHLRKGKRDCQNCGHKNIHNLFYVRNIYTNEIRVVGCECIKKFIGFEGKSYVSVLNGTVKNIPKDILEKAFGDKVINNWELNFLYGLCHKRLMSHKQIDLKLKLEKRIKNRYINRFDNT